MKIRTEQILQKGDGKTKFVVSELGVNTTLSDFDKQKQKILDIIKEQKAQLNSVKTKKELKEKFEELKKEKLISEEILASIENDRLAFLKKVAPKIPPLDSFELIPAMKSRLEGADNLGKEAEAILKDLRLFEEVNAMNIEKSKLYSTGEMPDIQKKLILFMSDGEQRKRMEQGGSLDIYKMKAYKYLDSMMSKIKQDRERKTKQN